MASMSRPPLAVTITHPERELFPGEGITKLDLANYYDSIAEFILPHLEGRPTTLVRCPEGIGSGVKRSCFFQKHVAVGLPASVTRVSVQEKEKVGEYVVVDTVKTLLALVQLGFLELHTSNARADKLEQPDRIVFDLDPDEAVPWARVVDGARAVRERLSALGLESFLKTTGGKGLHVVVPFVRGPDWDSCAAASRAVVRLLEAEDPSAYVTVMSKEKRKGKIFLDYLRNSRGATSVAAYSVRARPGAPVSMPVAWEALEDPAFAPGAFTLHTALAFRKGLKTDPWAAYAATKQRLSAAILKTLGVGKAS